MKLSHTSRILYLLLFFLLLLPFVVRCFIVGFNPASKADYGVMDNDPGLLKHAQTAAPVITALGDYHRTHAAYPLHASELADLLHLPSGTTLTEKLSYNWPDDKMDWDYRCLPGNTGYQLAISLGPTPDPCLLYVFNGTTGVWEFDPGTGDPVKPITLAQ